MDGPLVGLLGEQGAHLPLVRLMIPRRAQLFGAGDDLPEVLGQGAGNAIAQERRQERRRAARRNADAHLPAHDERRKEKVAVLFVVHTVDGDMTCAAVGSDTRIKYTIVRRGDRKRSAVQQMRRIFRIYSMRKGFEFGQDFMRADDELCPEGRKPLRLVQGDLSTANEHGTRALDLVHKGKTLHDLSPMSPFTRATNACGSRDLSRASSPATGAPNAER